MNRSQKRIYAAGRRVQSFLNENDSLLSNINASSLRSELDTVVAALGQNALRQADARVAAMKETSRYRALCLALRSNHMQPIVSIARSKSRTFPKLEGMTMPARNARIVGLLAHAQGMAQVAQPYAQMFIEAGLAEDFIAKLRSAADAVKTSIDTRAAASNQRSSTTETLGQLESRARTTLRALNDLVVPILSADAAKAQLLAQWKEARSVDSSSGRRPAASQRTDSSSMSNTNTELGGMSLPAPRSP